MLKTPEVQRCNCANGQSPRIRVFGSSGRQVEEGCLDELQKHFGCQSNCGAHGRLGGGDLEKTTNVNWLKSKGHPTKKKGDKDNNDIEMQHMCDFFRICGFLELTNEQIKVLKRSHFPGSHTDLFGQPCFFCLRPGLRSCASSRKCILTS